MKREIKFRAWDEKDKIMWMPQDLRNIIVGSWELESEDGESSLPQKDYVMFAHDDTEWMQFTGLLDKSGKEIYEGDILKRVVDKYIGTNLDTATNHMTKKPEISVVEYKGSCFSAFNNILHRVGKCEVIGNLYENPSLIDKSTINK